MIQVISKKHFAAKFSLAISKIFLQENNRSYNSYRFSCKFDFILVLSFFIKQKQGSGFMQVGGLTKRNIYVFCLQRLALYFTIMPNSIDIFSQGISVHIIVAWYECG